ncbi:MAG: helix-turn-helix transcriptional regulator, partial [Chthoniobacterales bacterium]
MTFAYRETLAIQADTMGYTSHSVDKLGSPFLLADEISFVIPKGGSVRLDKNHFKLLFILAGNVEHEIEGLEGRRSLTAGDILIAPVVGHHIYINKNPQRAATLQTIRIFLNPRNLGKRTSRRIKRPESDLGDYVLHHFKNVVQLSGGIDNEIMDLIHQFRRETETHDIGCRHRVRSICTELIIMVSRKLSRKSESEHSAPGRTQKQIVAAAKEFFFKHFSKDLTLAEIAWYVGKGEEHLARVFKSETGHSVFDYVRKTRINQAKTLMMNPVWSLTKIAEKCG